MDLNSSLASRIVREELTETEEGGSLTQGLQSRKPKDGSAGPQEGPAPRARGRGCAETVRGRGHSKERHFPGFLLRDDTVRLHTLSQGHNWEPLHGAAREKGGEGSSSRSSSAS